jgi:MFS family permease
MSASPRSIQRLYLLLLLLNTLAASFIWGINTLFLLDAGLSNTEAFAANAFFTAGMMVFEIPTGVVADTRGRRTSFLLGTATLAVSTALYLVLWHLAAPFWAWAATSMFLGLGFSFFSGAFEAWLVDALAATGHQGTVDEVLARGEIVEGAAMLGGSVAGGLLAQLTHVGVPYVVRAVLLATTFGVAWVLMHDVGFAPNRGERPLAAAKLVVRASIRYGLGNPPVRWLMLAAPFAGAVGIYAFYAMQPYLLELYGDRRAYGVAGLAAAVVGGAQIAGGLLVPHARRLFRRRTDIVIVGTVVSAGALAAIALVSSLVGAVALLVIWGLMFATIAPVRQAYLNGLIPSKQRATVLSFDSLVGSAGAAVGQPLLGRAADAWGYPFSYLCSAAVQALGLPLILLARREGAPSDPIDAPAPSEGADHSDSPPRATRWTPRRRPRRHG